MSQQQYLLRVLLNIFVLLLALFSQVALAVGTNAGMDISNTATANYTVGAANLVANSNTTTTTVAETLDVTVAWQDAANITVSPGDTSQVLTYLVTNTGNGNDSYTLSVNNTVAGDNFDPLLVNIYFDSNGNSTYDAGSDTLYQPGINDPMLAADGSLTVFVLNDIPAALNSADLGNSQLTVTSNTGSGTPGTTIAGAGESGTDAIVGNSGATASDIGGYQVSGAVVNLSKSVTISDPFGSNQPVPGASMTYSITVTVTGSGTASGVVITDPIPANTNYVTNSITLNTVTQTDADDPPTDNSDYNISNAGSITVDLGDLTSASPVQTITFDVTIN